MPQIAVAPVIAATEKLLPAIKLDVEPVKVKLVRAPFKVFEVLSINVINPVFVPEATPWFAL